MTITDLELSVQAGLEALRDIDLGPDAATARELLVPDGLTPVVELINENGRRKRSSAAAWNWNPQSDRIVISFRPAAANSDATVSSNPPPPTPEAKVAPPVERATDRTEISPVQPIESFSDPATPQEIIECCQALASAERSNRQFIALKWFRDDFLATVDFAWAKVPQRRQRVLSHAIEMGRIEAKKINNPKAPQFPTTTISLNRSIPTPGVPPRFQPIPIRGEPASATLMRDRGTF